MTVALALPIPGPPPIWRLFMDRESPQPPAAAHAPTDAELVSRSRANDREAMEALVRRHYRALYAVALAVMGNRAAAEDVCHEAMVTALARLDECRQPDRFAQWAAAIVRNKARNELVKPAVSRAVALDPRTAAAAEPLGRALERDELRAKLEIGIAHLTRTQREVLLLHDLHDWPHERIAEWIGTSAGMSRQHLFKARRLLRDALGPDVLREYFND